MANKPLLLGITGGIGSGKSTVCHVFAVLGIPIYHADDRAKWLVANDGEIREKIKSVFGEESFIQGQYNNSYIASRVFQSADLLKRLNAIIHPAVGADFKSWVNSCKHSVPYLIKEAALMVNTPGEQEMDLIAVVHAPDHLRVERVQSRDSHRSEEQIKNIMQNQLSQTKMMERAHFLIDNSGKQLLIPQILQINSSILNNR